MNVFISTSCFFLITLFHTSAFSIFPPINCTKYNFVHKHYKRWKNNVTCLLSKWGDSGSCKILWFSSSCWITVWEYHIFLLSWKYIVHSVILASIFGGQHSYLCIPYEITVFSVSERKLPGLSTHLRDRHRRCEEGGRQHTTSQSARSVESTLVISEVMINQCCKAPLCHTWISESE